ncbi:kinase-like domain-containing protein [Pavlovales sp. CCMP2436]|nr:kinase-like domain-containing protein [Pavlovales sp. CCMP2436]
MLGRTGWRHGRVEVTSDRQVPLLYSSAGESGKRVGGGGGRRPGGQVCHRQPSAHTVGPHDWAGRLLHGFLRRALRTPRCHQRTQNQLPHPRVRHCFLGRGGVSQQMPSPEHCRIYWRLRLASEGARGHSSSAQAGSGSGGGGGGGCGSAPGGPTAVLPSAAVSRSERERARQQQPSSMGGLPTELVCQYLHDVIRGMRFLHHTMGIVHGDLKPLNMLLKNGSVKLYVGTLPYCAPEIIESPRRILPSADVYSFGVALWEMCTGLFPWEGLLAHNRHKELKQRVVTFAERPDAQSCPAPLQTLMKACWTAAPLARPTFEVLASIEMCTLCSSTQTLHQLHLAVWKRFQ